MPGLIRSDYSNFDALGYLQWLSKREDDLSRQQHWLEPGAQDREIHLPEPEPLRQVTARPGDSITQLIGTSDPGSIGAFARANGLQSGDSTIFAGNSYVIPSELAETPSDRGEGLLMIRRDNDRLRQLRVQRERAEAERRGQSELLTGHFDQMRPSSGTTRTEGPLPAPEGSSQGLGVLNRSPVMKAFSGVAADEIGHQLGIGRGVYEMARDTANSLKPIPGLANPYLDIKIHGFKDSALGNIVGTALASADAGRKVANDPGIVPRAIGRKLHEMNLELNPLATPSAETATGEFQRRLPIASNQGKLAAEVASMAYGGGELRSVNGINKVREALYGPELFAKYDAGTQAALAEPYRGMGSHFVSREFGDKYNIPKWIIDSPFNVSKPPNLTKGEFYMYHSMYDPRSRANRLPNGLSRKAWKFYDFDAEPFGPAERLIYGAPGALKGTVGGLLGGVSGVGVYTVNAESSD